MRVCVIGTGYVGLVTGACLAEIGHDVVCIDTDQNKISRLSLGDMPIYEPGLKELVESNQRKKRLGFFTSVAEAAKRNCEFFFIAVGTPSCLDDGSADLSHVYKAAEDAARAIKLEHGKRDRFSVFVIKSTVPVGTGREIARRLGRHLNTDNFAVASNPEFLREGCAVEDFMAPDRIIVGSKSDKAHTLLRELYYPLLCLGRTPIVTTTVETAELTKYAANAFLATKVSFINELSRLCEKTGADVDELAFGMGLDKRIGNKFLKAGPGYGGSCFPKDTAALVKTARDFQSPVEIVETVLRGNNRHKQFALDKIRNAFDGAVFGKRIAILGLAFKARTDDVRDSPALAIINTLRNEGAIVMAYDPVAIDKAKALLGNAKVHYSATLPEALKDADGAVILTEWDEFRKAEWRNLASTMASPLLVDLRNIFSRQEAGLFGMKYISLGRKPVTISVPAEPIAINDLPLSDGLVAVSR